MTPATAIRFAGLALTGVLYLVLAHSALAHGPCRCVWPTVGSAGQQVTIQRDWPAYKVVFNPRPGDLATAPTGLASAYHGDARSTTVLSRSSSRPIMRARFKVPQAPPGVYLLLIFDGGEGGAHTTWDYFHIVGDPPAADPTPVGAQQNGAGRAATPADGDHHPTLLLVALASAAAAVAVAGLGVRRRRGRRSID